MAIFSPSLMCAQYGELKQEVRLLEEAGADRLHLDVMDGNYVQNFAMGMGDIKYIAQASNLETELHLMIKHPSRYIDQFADAGVNIIYFHPDSDYHPTTVIEKILKAHKTPGIVLNPGTSLASVTELFYVAKRVIIMGVNPGHAGQIYLPYVDQKIRQSLEIKEKYGLEIMIDGACSLDKIAKWSLAGVDGFVLGTAALFGKTGTYKENIQKLRMACKREVE